MQPRNSERKRRPQTAPTKSVVSKALEEHERSMKLPQFETHLRSFIIGGRIMSVIKQSKDNRTENSAPSNESSTSSINSSDGHRVTFKTGSDRSLTRPSTARPSLNRTMKTNRLNRRGGAADSDPDGRRMRHMLPRKSIKNVQLRIRMGQAWEMGASNCVADGNSSRLSIQPSDNDRRRGVNYVNKVLQQKYGPNYTYRSIFGQVIRTVVLLTRVSNSIKSYTTERIKQRAIREMVNKTKTWEIAISDEEKASKNYKFKRIANMALRQHIIESTYDQNPVEEIKDNQMEYESPYQIKKIKDRDSDWESLSFNHEYFERSRNNMLPKKCREICKKDPKERNHEEVMALRSYMVGLRSFELYSPKMQIALCRVVRFEAFGRGRIIVRIGAKGTSMYFISFGKVGITKHPDADRVFTQAEPITIERGGCFGEVALANKCTRTASVVCMEYTELLVIDKEDFDELKLDRYIHMEQNGRLQCFLNVPALSEFSYDDILFMVQNTKTEGYPINTIIKKSETESDYTYFVVRGTIEVFREIELNNCEQYHRETQQRYYGRTFKMHVGRYNQNHKIFIKITKIGPNEYFTLENKAASNPFTIVSQGATVVRIKNDFLNGMKMHQELLRNQSRIPNEAEIIQHFTQQNEWNFYKRGLVKNKMENVKRESIRPKNNVEDEPNIISLARTNKKQSEYIDGMHLPLFDLQQFKRQYL